MEEVRINVLDFTEYPGPRYKSQGKSSGELYYEKILKAEFQKVLEFKEQGKKSSLVLNLDGTAGYASSFLDECIGNLVYDYGAELVKEHLKIISEDEPDWKGVIFEETIPEWQKKKDKGAPRKMQ